MIGIILKRFISINKSVINVGSESCALLCISTLFPVNDCWFLDLHHIQCAGKRRSHKMFIYLNPNRIRFRLVSTKTSNGAGDGGRLPSEYRPNNVTRDITTTISFISFHTRPDITIIMHLRRGNVTCGPAAAHAFRGWPPSTVFSRSTASLRIL